jgi:hypothetical protein
MAVKSPSSRKKSKKVAGSSTKRPKTGLNAIPLDRDFRYCRAFFQDDIDQKDVIKLCKEYVRKTFSRSEAQAILANPEYHFSMYVGRAAAIFWMNHGLEFEEPFQEYPERVYQDFADLIEPGQKILDSKKKDENAKAQRKVLSPQELMRRKVNSTVGYDLDYLEDEWIEGQTTDIDLYTQFQKHELKGATVPYVKNRIEEMRSEYYDAYHKNDDVAVESFSHLSRKELKRRLEVCDTMLSDLDKIQAAAKATRKKRTPKARTADKQIKSLKYLKEDKTQYKIVSVDPLSVPGAFRLYTFNVKNRELTEYTTLSANGFEIKGTTIQNFDPETSRKTRLRKPDAFLPIVLKKTINQIDKEWKKLTTKTSEPTGRINADTILLRVEHK